MSQEPGFAFELKIEPSSHPDRLTTCGLSALVDGEAVWPVMGDATATLEIQADDLLSHLAEFWKPLLLRQVYPAPFNPGRPSRLRADALQRWAESPPEIADREDEVVTAFEDAHDFSHAFGGLFDLPSFWLMRAGDSFLCETQRKLWRLEYEIVHGALVDAGNALAGRLSEAGDKWDRLIAAWVQRDQADGISLLSWSAGLDPAMSRELVEDGLLEAPTSLADAANDNDELRIAARLAGALPPDMVREVIALARTFAGHPVDQLETLSGLCREQVEERYRSHPPYVQGEAAARRAREWLETGRDQPIDVFAIIRELGVEVRSDSVDPESLDGLAIWGSRFGPGMFLNLASERVSASNPNTLERDHAARITAAHELCHLLVDGGHPTSAVDVLMSRMPVAIEQRAKSFAGEFLLPSRTAARMWENTGSPRDRAGLRGVLARLAEEFLVPLAVASWKLDHGLQFRNIDLSAQLASIARWR